MNTCKHITEQLSGFLDGELTQQESQHIQIHLDECEDCTEVLTQITQLKQSVSSMEYKNVEQERLNEIMNDSTSNTLQSRGWILLIGGFVFFILIAFFHFLTDPEPMTIEKFAVISILLGLAALFISVLRQRLIAKKTDKYGRVDL